jgi:hypothetical protein
MIRQLPARPEDSFALDRPNLAGAPASEGGAGAVHGGIWQSDTLWARHA